MTLDDTLITVKIHSWVVRLRQPVGRGSAPIIVLLHGWTGDENVMWVFASRLPREALIIAPRGFYDAPLGGYGWYPHQIGSWPTLDNLKPVTQKLERLLQPENFPKADLSQVHLVGFSQGAALAYAYALLNPLKVTSVAGLSGFLPIGSDKIKLEHLLEGKAVFIAHGSQDDLVPIERARQAVEVFIRAGAQVTYCEDEVGHKLSANCFRGLQAFLNRQIQ